MGRLPLDLLRTEVGAREVENLLGRIEQDYVLNPGHAGFDRIEIDGPEPFSFDP
ncbi:MAG: antitoxin Xre/MbcA/ParS toxin-binding domain-containing protein, partial [Planctomycetota bacterium]